MLSAVIAMVSSLAVGVTANAGAVTPKKKLTPLQQGMAYYQGKTVNFIVPTTAGAQFDTEARILTAALGSYLHATFNVEDISSGLSITGQDTLAHAAPDGLTVGMLETGLDINNVINRNPALNFNPARENMLGGFTNSTTVIVVSPSAPYKNFGELISLSASTPPNLLLQTVSATNTTVRLFTKAFGINDKITFGYSNSSAIITGFLRGDGNFVSQSVNAVLPLVQGGKALPLAQQTIQPAGTPANTALTNVPTFAQLEKKYPPTTKLEKRAMTLFNAIESLSSIAIAAPSATAYPEVLAMRTAIKKELKSASVTSQLENIGDPTGYESYQLEKSGYLYAETLVKGIQSLLGT